MNYRVRYVEDRLKELFEHFPVVAVTGARQTGKSTLVQHLFGDRLRTIVFDPVQDVGQARANPDLFLDNNPGPLFLDEIQYAPELLPALKRRADIHGKPGQFVLSGSQSLSVLRHVAESLAGRVAFVDLLPMGLRELTSRTTADPLRAWTASPQRLPPADPDGGPSPWYRAVWRGGYPALLDMTDWLVPAFFEGYVRTYIERDVRVAAGVGDLQAFGRFCSLLAGLSACEVNASQVGRELGIDRRTALAWKSALMATYQWFEIPSFTRNAAKRVAGKAKGYLADTGLICYLQRIGDPGVIAGHPLQGQLLETWVVQEIIRRVQRWDVRPLLHHFRSRAGAEVDLILDIDGALFPIEIRSTNHPRARDTSGDAAFRSAFPGERIQKGLLVCAVDRPQWVTEQVLAMPWWIL